MINRELETLREDIIKRIRSKNDTLTQFTGSDPGMMLIDAIASSIDSMNYYIDRVRLEQYISSCTQKKSILRIADLTSYFVKGMQPPSIELKVELDTENNADFSRKQITLDGVDHVIVTQVKLDSSNRDTKVVAYNGVDTTKVISKTDINFNDPKFIVDKVESVSYQGFKVYISLGDKSIELNKRYWYLSRSMSDNAEVILRDNRIYRDDFNGFTVKYIKNNYSNFQYVKKGVESKFEGLKFNTLSESTPGSSDEIDSYARRNITNSHIKLETLVTTLDFSSLAESDLEVRQAKSFDRNTPSIVTESNAVYTYIDMIYDSNSAELPLTLTDRLNYEVQQSNTILGIKHYWKKANRVYFDIDMVIYSLATDQIDDMIIKSKLEDKYTDLKFGYRVNPAEISRDVLRMNEFIERIEITSPSSTLEVGVNEVPYLRNISIKVKRGGLHEGY